jgi:hypothetical protein
MPVARSSRIVYSGGMRAQSSASLLLTVLFCTSVLGSLPAAQAGELTLSCDSGGVKRADCIELLKQSVSALGCAIQNVSCKTHPWGSDFIKSWICSGQSNNCQIVPRTGCPTGTISTFKGDWEVCLKTSGKVESFHGECRHQQASHPMLMKTCSEDQFTCVNFGGTPETLSVKCKTSALGSSQLVTGTPNCEAVQDQCTKLNGEVFGTWNLMCRFKDVIIPVTGATCAEIREDCERENSEKGTESKLLSCISH